MKPAIKLLFVLIKLEQSLFFFLLPVFPWGQQLESYGTKKVLI